MGNHRIAAWLRSAIPAIFLSAALATPALALEPDEIALIINGKDPASRELANSYALARHIPPGRIIALELDPPGDAGPVEEIPFREFEPRVAAPIREFLGRSGLTNRVKCLVTFWGVPLRIGRRTNTPAESAELASITDDLNDVLNRSKQAVAALETLARSVETKFVPTTAPAHVDEAATLAKRADDAIWSAVAGLLSLPPGDRRTKLSAQLIGLMDQLAGPVMTTVRLASPTMAPLATPPITAEQLAEAQRSLGEIRQHATGLNVETSVGRAGLRTLVHDRMGLLATLRVLENQSAALQTDQTESALDNELALLWWGYYPRFRWVRNPLYVHYTGPKPTAPMLMVSRLDGPSVPIVHMMITTSVDVEKTGLTGQVAIDARGKPPGDGYGDYDQTLRNLAALVRTRTNLKVTLDNTEALFPPYSVRGVALYCGWYKLRHYVPCCQFARGAVGFHVASFELVGLHAADETGWVRGLLGAGVVGTVGPVAEPYVQSFPKADEFFPLLLTGKLTLAEVYWRTTPMASWMQALVGDPLYRPYAANPALTLENLPPELAGALDTVK